MTAQPLQDRLDELSAVKEAAREGSTRPPPSGSTPRASSPPTSASNCSWTRVRSTRSSRCAGIARPASAWRPRSRTATV
ncbi:hypothetical protein LV779_25440 [Streptomyces thinghirensis]|nr:hypothetical protein [Streptomyces thinghirensis]